MKEKIKKLLTDHPLWREEVPSFVGAWSIDGVSLEVQNSYMIGILDLSEDFSWVLDNLGISKMYSENDMEYLKVYEKESFLNLANKNISYHSVKKMSKDTIRKNFSLLTPWYSDIMVGECIFVDGLIKGTFCFIKDDGSYEYQQIAGRVKNHLFKKLAWLKALWREFPAFSFLEKIILL